MTLGIAFSGGGVRSASQLGILQALYDAGMQKPIIFTGTSGGAVVASLLALGYTPRQAFVKFRETTSIIDVAYSHIISSLLLGKQPEGLLKGKKLEKKLSLAFRNKRFGEIDRKRERYLAIVTTEITMGKQVIFVNGAIAKSKINDDNFVIIPSSSRYIAPIVRASCSLPAVFIPKEIEGMKLVDGGLTNNLPSDIAFGLGADRVISIDLGYSGQVGKSVGMLPIIKQTIEIMTERIVDINADNLDIYLNPKIYDVAVLDISRADECYFRGYAYGKTVAKDVVKSLETGDKFEVR